MKCCSHYELLSRMNVAIALGDQRALCPSVANGPSNVYIAVCVIVLTHLLLVDFGHA